MDLGRLIVEVVVVVLTLITKVLRVLGKALVDLFSWIIDKFSSTGTGGSRGWHRGGRR